MSQQPLEITRQHKVQKPYISHGQCSCCCLRKLTLASILLVALFCLARLSQGHSTSRIAYRGLVKARDTLAWNCLLFCRAMQQAYVNFAFDLIMSTRLKSAVPCRIQSLDADVCVSEALLLKL